MFTVIIPLLIASLFVYALCRAISPRVRRTVNALEAADERATRALLASLPKSCAR